MAFFLYLLARRIEMATFKYLDAHTNLVSNAKTVRLEEGVRNGRAALDLAMETGHRISVAPLFYKVLRELNMSSRLTKARKRAIARTAPKSPYFFASKWNTHGLGDGSRLTKAEQVAWMKRFALAVK